MSLKLWAEELNLQLRDIVYDWFLDEKNLENSLREMDNNLMYIIMDAEKQEDKEVLREYKNLLHIYADKLNKMEQ